jgi:hypothetical protein
MVPAFAPPGGPILHASPLYAASTLVGRAFPASPSQRRPGLLGVGLRPRESPAPPRPRAAAAAAAAAASASAALPRAIAGHAALAASRGVCALLSFLVTKARQLVLALALLGALAWGAPARAEEGFPGVNDLRDGPGGAQAALVADARLGAAAAPPDMAGEEVRRYGWRETWGSGGFRNVPAWRWVAREDEAPPPTPHTSPSSPCRRAAIRKPKDKNRLGAAECRGPRPS